MLAIEEVEANTGQYGTISMRRAMRRGTKIMRCNECNKGFKFPSTATILKRHWSKQHSEKEQPADRIGSHTSPPHTKKSKIEQALVNVVSIPALAINMLLHPLVRNLFQVLNPRVEMPESFGTMKEMLRVQFNSVRKSIKEEIAKLQTRPSITCDVWSDSSMKHAYLGITAHFCDANGSLKRYFLGLRELKGSHNRFLLRRETEDVLEEYGLQMDGLYKVVTDNGSNIVAAFKDVLKIHVDTMFLDEPSEEEEDEENEEDEIYSMETEILLQTVFPLRIRCFAHSLQLVILRFFKELVEPISGFCTLRALVGKFKHSVSATQDLLSSTGKILVKASSTRWASFILVIERYLEVYEVVRSIARAKKWSCPTAVETEFLRGVYNMMKIMVDVLKRIQGEKVVTISHAYGFVKAMKRGVAKFKENLETRNLAEALLKLIDDRFCVMYDALHLSFDPIYLMAAAFDPNTAHLLEEIEFELAVSSIQGLIKRSEEAENVDYVPLNKERSELDVMLGEIVAEQRAKRQQKEGLHAGAKAWIRDVLKRGRASMSVSKTPIDPIKYWKGFLDTVSFSDSTTFISSYYWLFREYKSIATLALEVLAVPGSDGPIERIFSQAGLATARHRNRTDGNLLNYQLVVYCNRVV